MEDPPIDTNHMRDAAIVSYSSHGEYVCDLLTFAADWIDAVLTAWERGER